MSGREPGSHPRRRAGTGPRVVVAVPGASTPTCPAIALPLALRAPKDQDRDHDISRIHRMTASAPPSRLRRSAMTAGLVALVALAATACSEDAPARSPLVTTLPEASWTACASDDACEARWLSCRGWRAVNREHGTAVEGWYARQNRAYLASADCDGRPLVQPPAAFCRARQCTLE